MQQRPTGNQQNRSGSVRGSRPRRHAARLAQDEGGTSLSHGECSSERSSGGDRQLDSRTAIITREEFLTPPEFRGLEANHHPAARVGGARIELIESNGETHLGTCYQQIPVKVMSPFNFSTEPAALLYLINLTAGLMDGDSHLIDLVARSGTKTVVTGQSATRVHPALSSYATQQWNVEVEDNASLVVLPGPLIPFQKCRYFQRGRVELAPSARLIWGDIWLPGRYDRGELSERFQFERIVQDFEVRRSDSLIFRDRFCWNGPWSTSEASWHFGENLATASLFVAGPFPEALPAAVAGTRRAVFPIGSSETCLRWCGSPAAVTSDMVQTSMFIAGSWEPPSNGTQWLLNSSELAPNHWFSIPPLKQVITD